MNEVIQFLIYVAAGTLGILLGAWIVRAWDGAWRKIRHRKKRR